MERDFTEKKTSQGNKIISKILHNPYIWILLICIAVEIFIFNGKSFKWMGSSSYEQQTYEISDIETIGFDVSGDEISYIGGDGQEASVVIDNIGTNVGTIYLDVESDVHTVVAFSIYYTDSANRYIYRNIYRETAEGLEKSKYTACNFNGESSKIKIAFWNLQEDETLTIKSISFNKRIPIFFNVVRVFILYIIVAGIYGVRNGALFQAKVNAEPYWYKQAGIMALSLLLFLVVAWVLYSNSVETETVEVIDGQKSFNNGGNYDEYVELTEALIEGKTYISEEPSDEILSLDNPYDLSEREGHDLEGNVDYRWDHALYNGRYYIYYGIVPAILLFVPFKLLTGHYLTTGFAAFLFFVVYIVFLNLIVYEILPHILSDISFGSFWLSTLTMDAAACVLPVATRLQFYELTYASMLAFIAVGFFILCRWWYGSRTWIKLFSGSLCMGLAVGCRPTAVFYSFLLVPFILKELVQNKRNGEHLGRFVRKIAPMAVAYVIVALPLMYYNYIRFGSIVEFGQSYQLTVSNMMYEGNQTASLPWCIWLGAFEPFSISAEFPYIRWGSNYRDYTGYFYNHGTTVTIFSLIPLLWCTFIPALWEKWKNSHSRFSTMTLAYTYALGWVIAIFIFWSAGLDTRYTMEAMPVLAISAVLLLCYYIETHPNSRKTLMTVFAALTIYSLYASFAIGIIGDSNKVYEYHRDFYYAIKYMFSFWL